MDDNKQLKLFNGFEIENMSEGELQALQEKIVNLRMSNIEKAIKATNDKVERMDEKLERTIQLSVTAQRVREPKYGYVNQGEFGRYFDVPISSQRVGKLFKVVGLAQKSLATTKPYWKDVPQYALNTTYEHYTSTTWNYTECLKKIDAWLMERGLFESFYSCKTVKEKEKFIDDLYERYMN